MIRTDLAWQAAMHEAKSLSGSNYHLGRALHVANLLAWRKYDDEVAWAPTIRLRFAPHAAEYGAPVGAPVRAAMAQVLTNADEFATTPSQHEAIQALLFMVIGWRQEPSSPDDGCCDGCGTELHEIETDIYINADEDAFCGDCFIGFHFPE